MAASNRNELYVDGSDDDFFDDRKNRSSRDRSFQNNSERQTEGQIKSTNSVLKRTDSSRSSGSGNSGTASRAHSSDESSESSSDTESDVKNKFAFPNTDSRKTSSGTSEIRVMTVHAKVPRNEDSDDADRASESSNSAVSSDESQRSDQHPSSKSARKEMPSDDDDDNPRNKSVSALSKITEESDSLARQDSRSRMKKSRAKSAPVRRARFDKSVPSVGEGKLDNYKELLREVLDIDSRYKGSLRPSSASTYSDHFRQYRQKSAAIEIPYRWRRNYTFTDDKVRGIERENQRLLKRIQNSTAEVNKTWSSSCSKPLRFNRKAAAETVRTRKLQEIEIQNLALLKRLRSIQPSHDICRDVLIDEYKRRQTAFLGGSANVIWAAPDRFDQSQLGRSRSDRSGKILPPFASRTESN